MSIMKDFIVTARNYMGRLKYQYIWKPIFFCIDPEVIHDKMVDFLEFFGGYVLLRKLTYFCFGYSNAMLEQNILGIYFKNPVGLSAGFDKNATLMDIMPALGFGFTEVGSITGEACLGNPKPRLWRLKKSKSLAVYYGLKNDGCVEISKRLKNKKFDLPVGINMAKTNCRETADTENAIADYFKSYQAFTGIGNYAVINISCPNAFGGQPFNDSARLEKLMSKITSIPKTKPIFVKISPDLQKNEVDEIINIASKFKLDGFICTNLTKNRNNKNILDKNVPEKGGLSGKIVDTMSDDLIRYVYKKTNGQTVIIGSGGVFTAEDAYRKIKAGASLIELITGMIYEGPQIASAINLGLVKLLQKDGCKNISEAVGREN